MRASVTKQSPGNDTNSKEIASRKKTGQVRKLSALLGSSLRNDDIDSQQQCKINLHKNAACSAMLP